MGIVWETYHKGVSLLGGPWQYPWRSVWSSLYEFHPNRPTCNPVLDISMGFHWVYSNHENSQTSSKKRVPCFFSFSEDFFLEGEHSADFFAFGFRGWILVFPIWKQCCWVGGRFRGLGVMLMNTCWYFLTVNFLFCSLWNTSLLIGKKNYGMSAKFRSLLIHLGLHNFRKMTLA